MVLFVETLPKHFASVSQTHKDENRWKDIMVALVKEAPIREMGDVKFLDEWEETIDQFKLRETMLTVDKIIRLAKVLHKYKSVWSEELRNVETVWAPCAVSIKMQGHHL